MLISPYLLYWGPLGFPKGLCLFIFRILTCNQLHYDSQWSSTFWLWWALPDSPLHFFIYYFSLLPPKNLPIHTHTHTHTHTYIHSHPHKQTYTQTYTQVYAYNHTGTHTITQAHTHAHIHTHTYTQERKAFIWGPFTDFHLYSIPGGSLFLTTIYCHYPLITHIGPLGGILFFNMHACVCVCVRACVRVCVCACACACLCVCLWMFVWKRACVFVLTHSVTQSRAHM